MNHPFSLKPVGLIGSKQVDAQYMTSVNERALALKRATRIKRKPTTEAPENQLDLPFSRPITSNQES